MKQTTQPPANKRRDQPDSADTQGKWLHDKYDEIQSQQQMAQQPAGQNFAGKAKQYSGGTNYTGYKMHESQYAGGAQTMGSDEQYEDHHYANGSRATGEDAASLGGNTNAAGSAPGGNY
jgi:CASC3/Barentsz eIF4AIII binding